MHVHGDNLTEKERHKTKFLDDVQKQYLAEIRVKYDLWKQANIDLKGPFERLSADDEEVLAKRTLLFSEYKDFVDQQKYAELFDSRSNLHSSILEEFIYFLFKDLVYDFSPNALLGKAHAFKRYFFQCP